jgi:hypothetical protein
MAWTECFLNRKKTKFPLRKETVQKVCGSRRTKAMEKDHISWLSSNPPTFPFISQLANKALFSTSSSFFLSLSSLCMAVRGFA